MKSKSGVSLITMIVTMMIMLILIGVVGKYSIDNIKKANEAVKAREFASVRDYVITRQGILDSDSFGEILKNHSDLLLNGELAYIIADGKLLNSEISNIIDVNSSDIAPQYKYYYLPSTGNYFEDAEFSEGGITVKDVQNDYVVNFYTATVISLSNDYFRIDGVIKGLSEILSEIE